MSLCKNCLGCNQLEDKNFKEVYRCKNFTNARGAINQTMKNKKEV